MAALLSLVMGDRKEGCHMSQRGALYFSVKSWVIERWNIEPIDVGKVSNGHRHWSLETGLWYSKVPFSLSILERLSHDPTGEKIKSRKGLPGACVSLQTTEGSYQCWGSFFVLLSCGENQLRSYCSGTTTSTEHNKACNVFQTVLLIIICFSVWLLGILWGFLLHLSTFCFHFLDFRNKSSWNPQIV